MTEEKAVVSRELPELYKWVQLECKAARVAEHFIDRVKLGKSSSGGEVKGLTRLLVPMICIASVKDTTNTIHHVLQPLIMGLGGKERNSVVYFRLLHSNMDFILTKAG